MIWWHYILLSFWIGCGIYVYGYSVAYYAEYWMECHNPVKDRVMSSIYALFGPVAIVTDLLVAPEVFDYGWRL